MSSERFKKMDSAMKNGSAKQRQRDHIALVFRSDMPPPNSDKLKAARVAAAKSLAGQDSWTINPKGNRFCGYFDQAIAISLLFTALVTPYEIGFLGSDSTRINALFVIGSFVNFVFLIDVGLQFFLHYEKSTEYGTIMETNHWIIVRNYLRGHFFMDLVSSVPWGVVEYLFLGGSGNLSILRLLRLLRLVKLLRVVRGSRLIEKYKSEVAFSFAHVTLSIYVTIILVFAHWTACLWGFAASGDVGWIREENLDGEPPFFKYSVALYFAVMTITTVGYGDVTPTNRNEYLLVTVIMIAGGFLWAYVIGGICNVVSNMDVDKRQFQQDFDRVNSMLNDLGMPHQFCLYVRRYMFNAEDMLRRNTYNDLINMLTPQQQREIAVHRSKANLVQIPYLRDCSPECVLKVYSALRQMVFAPQEFLDAPYTLYIIVNSGVVAKGGMIFSRGSCLAADFILESEELVDPTFGTALTFVQVECLHRDTLLEVLEAFPRDKAIVRRAKIRLSFMRKVVVMSKQYQRELATLKEDEKRRKRMEQQQIKEDGSVSASASSGASGALTVVVADADGSDHEGASPTGAGDQVFTVPVSPKNSISTSAYSDRSPDFVSRMSSVREKKDFHHQRPPLDSRRQTDFRRRTGSYPGPGGAAASTQGMKMLQTTMKAIDDRTANLEASVAHIAESMVALTQLISSRDLSGAAADGGGALSLGTATAATTPSPGAVGEGEGRDSQEESSDRSSLL